ncbi:hypothetical protein AVEN_209034-1 [Araneus ventricosus]|uniref:Uncharacterized protein n=1 Tax=Araneus ventricosus TaxID=182803 RepID=A0A4Y2KIV3_ARAVE|nr:hypothetical protein AVEN_209034-1 [Araneus ventricosus]
MSSFSHDGSSRPHKPEDERGPEGTRQDESKLRIARLTVALDCISMTLAIDVQLSRGKDISLSPASTELPIEIQEFIDSYLKLPSAPLTEDTVMKNIQLSCTSKESPLHVEEVISELPSTSAESPSQFSTEPVKRTIEDMVCIVCSKAASGALKCKSCDIFR